MKTEKTNNLDAYFECDGFFGENISTVSLPVRPSDLRDVYNRILSHSSIQSIPYSFIFLSLYKWTSLFDSGH